MSNLVDLSHCRVLIVDDVQSNIDVLVETLRDHHLISIALDGESALASIARSPPDLVMLDLMMPRLDGYEVCRRLRAEPATQDLPVIFLSALGEGKSKARAFEAGGTDYLTKPFDGLELRARVRSLLQAKMYQDTVRVSLASELRVAQEIQSGMVPTDFSTLMNRLPIDVHAQLAPAKEVGGDLYDVFPLGEDKVCFVIGDVSGKGIPAALFMAITTTLVRATARHVREPEQILAFVNQELASRNHPSAMFVKLFCAVLDTHKGRLAWANAGHSSPTLLREGEAPRSIADHAGRAIGIEPDLTFVRRELQLEPGDAIFLCTEGLAHAFNPDRQSPSDARLLASLAAGPADAKGMVEQMLVQARALAPGEPQADDIALLALRWMPRRSTKPEVDS